MVAEVRVSIPARIAELAYPIPTDQAALLERALMAAQALDIRFGPQMAAFTPLLLRTESVASSRIERVSTSVDDLARAIAGAKASQEARTTLAAAEAIESLVSDVATSGRFTLEGVLSAHARLMRDDPMDAPYAGALRDMQDWIGGSDYSPRGALFVPPPPGLVPTLMADLLAFLNRDDLPTLAQAAIAHAQFESIHPFTDGNGRIGRALINSVLRRRGVTTDAVLPVASALVADTAAYFDLLGAYREGRAAPFVAYLAQATVDTARAATTSADELAALPGRWLDTVRPQQGSAVRALIGRLVEHPVFDADDVAQALEVADGTAYRAIHRLEDAGIVRSVTRSQRHQVWIASDVMDEIEGLVSRVREIRSGTGR